MSLNATELPPPPLSLQAGHCLLVRAERAIWDLLGAEQPELGWGVINWLPVRDSHGLDTEHWARDHWFLPFSAQVWLMVRPVQYSTLFCSQTPAPGGLTECFSHQTIIIFSKKQFRQMMCSSCQKHFHKGLPKIQYLNCEKEWMIEVRVSVGTSNILMRRVLILMTYSGSYFRDGWFISIRYLLLFMTWSSYQRKSGQWKHYRPDSWISSPSLSRSNLMDILLQIGEW